MLKLVAVFIALACAYWISPASAAYVGTDVSYGFIHGAYDFTNASLNGSGPILWVSPGAPVSFNANYSINDTNNSYCPGCNIQLYVGLSNTSPSQSAGFYNGAIGSSSTGVVSASFAAPTLAGEYDIGSSNSLQYNYISNTAVGTGTDLPTQTSGAYIAAIKVPEPASLVLLGSALLILGVLRKRRI